jgi:hypothetical protein
MNSAKVEGSSQDKQTITMFLFVQFNKRIIHMTFVSIDYTLV